MTKSESGKRNCSCKNHENYAAVNTHEMITATDVENEDVVKGIRVLEILRSL